MKNITYTLIIIFFVFSCTKEKNNANEKVIISGTIVTDCAGTPYANEDFVLLETYNAFLNTGGDVIPFTTDANGNFSAQCSPTLTPEPVEIRIGDNGGFPILSFSSETDLNIGILNTTPTANYQLKIKVNNSYSIGDTLLIGDQSGLKRYKFGYPYPDTVFSIIYNYSHSISAPTISKKDNVPYSVYYKIYSGQLNKPSYNEKKYFHLPKEFKGCSSIINQVELTID